uniref:Uncharacterized protein n=1 Tax=Salmonella phage PMBT35 TaxID=3137287 RepID=A0AAU8BVE9_9VIRU
MVKSGLLEPGLRFRHACLFTLVLHCSRLNCALFRRRGFAVQETQKTLEITYNILKIKYIYLYIFICCFLCSHCS